MSEIVNQNNLTDIIKSIQNNIKAVETIVIGVSKSISKIVNDKNATEFSKGNKVFNTILNTSKSYLDLASNIIETFCIEIDGKNLSALLGYVQYYDTIEKNGQIVEDYSKEKKSKYTVVEAIGQISNVVNTITNMLSTLGKSNFGFKTIINIKINILLMK